MRKMHDMRKSVCLSVCYTHVLCVPGWVHHQSVILLQYHVSFHQLSIIISFACLIEATVALNFPCGPNDVCDDVNALCVGGVCQCRPLYYQESNVCSQFFLYWLLITTILIISSSYFVLYWSKGTLAAGFEIQNQQMKQFFALTV